MGIKERKDKEKQELKELILAAANDIFVRQGLEAVSIRAIADKIEYSPATIYLYYKDKRTLLFDIHERGFELFFTKLRQAAEAATSPMDGLHRMGHKYIEFALEQPHYYDLMFIREGVLPDERELDQELWDKGFQSLHYLRARIQACMDAGQMVQVDIEACTLSIWAHVHGLASLYLRGRLDHSMKGVTNVQALMHQAIDDTLAQFHTR